MARGNNGQKVFLSDEDYEAFLDQLLVVRGRYPFYLYAYVLMPNHFHLLLAVKESPTGRIMQSLLTGYVRRFNQIHRHKGHLFQGRYKAIVCDRDSYLLELVRYIHLNPQRAKMVRQPGQWRWTGHGEYLQTNHRGLIDPRPVMDELRTPKRYEAFIREGAQQPYRAEWHPGEQAPFLGPAEFEKKLARPRKKDLRRQPLTLEVLIRQAAKQSGIDPRAARGAGRTRLLGEVRRRFIEAAVLEQGYRAADVAVFLGRHASNVSRALQRGPTAIKQLTQV
jgi:REP element-mobilizing transposase RayT